MPGARVTSGERVALRIVESEDIPFLQRASANPDLRYPLGNPIRSQEAFDIAESGTDRLLVTLEDGVPPGSPSTDDVTRIGQVTVADMNYKRPELGYWLVPSVHGEGYGKEAVSLAIEYVFRAYDTPAVGAEAYDFNDASRGLLESLGFAEEGRRRKYMFVDGEHRDMIQYGLLREEWDERS
ncbi:GNAT family N-acetyltransferase [Natrialba aegyptia]|uniref:Protein N-acetyltransferase-like protein n=1 Tax=Natrialba aegyptia DSM 13077 TaxID=1227491 RepID=M0BH85_9EURY|nr:GNAT family protein [Natrialba aegyptia]ELZ08989.1 protein N-acetyltransferase-like protein [Natrialba aegyptia DSM 13077]